MSRPSVEKRYDFSLIGREEGEKLLDLIRGSKEKVPPVLNTNQIAFLQYPKSAKKQRELKARLHADIEAGVLQASPPPN